MADNWRERVREGDRYLGRPTLSYSQTLTVALPGPFQLVNFGSTWMGCVLTCLGAAGASCGFSLNSQNLTSELASIASLTQVGPFILTPGTGIIVQQIPGYGGADTTVSAIVWEDTQGILIHRQDELIRLIRAQNEARGIVVAPEPPARLTNAAQVKGY